MNYTKTWKDLHPQKSQLGFDRQLGAGFGLLIMFTMFLVHVHFVMSK